MSALILQCDTQKKLAKPNSATLEQQHHFLKQARTSAAVLSLMIDGVCLSAERLCGQAAFVRKH